MPFASNGNVRLVGAPGTTDGPRESVPALLKFRHVPGYPSEDCAVGHRDPALRHHCNEVPIAQPIRDVPANAQLNDFSIEHSSAVDWVTGDRFGHSEPLLGVRIIRERPQMHRSPQCEPIENPASGQVTTINGLGKTFRHCSTQRIGIFSRHAARPIVECAADHELLQQKIVRLLSQFVRNSADVADRAG